MTHGTHGAIEVSLDTDPNLGRIPEREREREREREIKRNGKERK